MQFWIVATLLALAISGLLALALIRRRADDEPPAAYDLRVYRDQLKEVDRDLARGVVGEADAERARTEISRRILAADAQLEAAKAPGAADQRPPLLLAFGLVAALVGGGIWLYRELGAPGYEDLPRQDRIAASEEARQNRPSQSQAEADVPPQPTPDADPQLLDLMEKLRAKVAETPDDLRGQELLAEYEYQLGNFAAAHQAQAQVIRLRGDAASAGDYAALAEMMILAAAGYVSPEAEAALDQATKLDPRHGPTRFYSGLLLAQIDRPDLAFAVWSRLLRDSTPNAPWVPTIEAQMPMLAELAGVEYTPSPRVALPGPSQDAVEAAQDMSEEDRAAMIRGMVDGLEDRLTSEGGAPEEWARLIGALAVLNEPARAATALAGARAAFAGDAAALSTVNAAAERAGLTE